MIFLKIKVIFIISGCCRDSTAANINQNIENDTKRETRREDTRDTTVICVLMEGPAVSL